MTTLPTISEALKELTKRNQFHERILLGIMGVLALFGLLLLGYAAFFSAGTERVASVIGGGLLEGLILVPYNKIHDLRGQNIIIGMLAAIIDRFQDQVPVETLNDIIKKLLEGFLRK